MERCDELKRCSSVRSVESLWGLRRGVGRLVACVCVPRISLLKPTARIVGAESVSRQEAVARALSVARIVLCDRRSL